MLVITSKAGRILDVVDVARRAEAVLGWESKSKFARKAPEYQRIRDLIMEFTQSCNKQEVIAWMHHYMQQAILFEVGKPIMDEIHKDLCLAKNAKEVCAMFLAAYDIYKEVSFGG